MSFAGKIWKLLVGIKDGLVLVFMLAFFGLLFAALSARPNPAQVREGGALLLELEGYVVEEKSEIDPVAALLSGTAPVGEYQARDIVHVLDEAAKDEDVSAVVLDLSQFLGGGQVHMQQIGAALDRVRQADKPVLAYAYVYGDDGVMLAAHASEVWTDPLGGAIVAGPGGERLYFAGLLDRFNVNAHVYKVGTYKSAVEPFTETGMSEPARENASALYGALWEEWQADVKKARPKAQLAAITADPVSWIEASNGNTARAALRAGLVDKLGSREAFGKRVAEITGEDEWDDLPGAFPSTDLDTYLAARPYVTDGKAIGVVTIAGEIVDGDAGPGVAGGERIAELLDEALDDDLAGLVVRVDSPGGSVTASEEIRRAILRHKAKGVPVAVSMGNVAASGGYWVSTPADRIFAEPETITGSIGIFGVLPSFEGTLADYGVQSDGFRTTPLSGQPDILGGFTPEVDQVLQSTIEQGYTRFISLVGKSRGMSLPEVDRIGQGRVWDGGTARQIGLVDQFGGLDTALAWVAEQAELEDGDWHAQPLTTPVSEYDALLRSMLGTETASAPRDVFALLAGRQSDALALAQADAGRLFSRQGMQVHCLECPRPLTSRAERGADTGWLARLAAFLAD